MQRLIVILVVVEIINKGPFINVSDLFVYTQDEYESVDRTRKRQKKT